MTKKRNNDSCDLIQKEVQKYLTTGCCLEKGDFTNKQLEFSAGFLWNLKENQPNRDFGRPSPLVLLDLVVTLATWLTKVNQ